MRRQKDVLLRRKGQFMKRMTALIAVLTLIAVLLCACRAEKPEETTVPEPEINCETLASVEDAKDLRKIVVYFSLGEGADKTAKLIAEKTGAELFEIETENGYPDGGEDALRRELETGALPVVKNRLKSITDYDAVFIGFPAVDGKMPAAVISFLQEYDFRETVLLPFCCGDAEDYSDITNRIDALTFGSSQAVLLTLKSEDNIQEKTAGWLSGLGF